MSRETIADHIPWDHPLLEQELISKGICPCCCGTGSVVGETYTASSEDGELMLEQALESCDDCHATGKLLNNKWRNVTTVHVRLVDCVSTTEQ